MAVYSLATSMWGSDQAFDDVIAGVAAAGFDQCELAAWMNLEDQLTAGDRRRSLNRHGVSARTVHPQIANVDLSALDDEIRTRSVSIVGGCLESSAELGGFAAIIHPTGADTSREEDVEARIAAFRRSLDTLVEQAEQIGIRLACENLQLKGEPRPLCRMAELRAVVDEYSPTVGICLDTGHANNNALEPAEEARIAGHRLIALHFQDTDGIEDRHWVPGTGSIQWHRLHAALREIQFRGAWTLELKAHDASPADVASAARRIADAWEAGRFPSGNEDDPVSENDEETLDS